MLHGQFQADFYGRGTIIGEKEMREFARNPLAQPRNELFGGIVRETSQDDLLELASLFGNRRGDPGVCMAMKIHPPGRDRINNLAAVGGVEHRAFGSGYKKRRRIEDGVRERV